MRDQKSDPDLETDEEQVKIEERAGFQKLVEAVITRKYMPKPGTFYYS